MSSEKTLTGQVLEDYEMVSIVDLCRSCTTSKWCPGAVTLGHPWPLRHRCIHAQWSLPHIRVLRDTGAWPRPASRPVPGLTSAM